MWPSKTPWILVLPLLTAFGCSKLDASSHRTGTTAADQSGGDASLAAPSVKNGPKKAPAISLAALHPKRSGQSAALLDAGETPDDPYNLSVSVTTTTLDVTWSSDDFDTTGFLANVTLGEQDSPTCVGGWDTGISEHLYLNNLDQGVTYTVAVCAYDGAGNLSDSIYAYVTTDTYVAPPAPPTDLSFSSATPTSLTFDWDWNDSTATNAYLAIVQGRNPVACDTGYTASYSEFTFDNLQPNTLYTVSICNHNAGGFSSGVSLSATTPLAPPPDPTNVTVTPTSSSVTVKWASGGGDTTGFLVAITANANPADCSAGVDVGSKTSYTLAGLGPDTYFGVRVCAYNAADTASAGFLASTRTSDRVINITFAGSLVNATTNAAVPAAHVSLQTYGEAVAAIGKGYALPLAPSVAGSATSLSYSLCASAAGFNTLCKNVVAAFGSGSLAVVATNFALVPTNTAALPPTIYCQKTGTTIQAGNTFLFQSPDCGGFQPDSTYIATSSLVQINGGNAGYVVNQPFQGAAAGMWFYATAGSQAYSLAAVYLKKGSDIYCVKSGATVAGGNTFNFTAANCGGTLPDSTYIATSSLVQINGGNAGYVVNQPFQGGKPGMWFYAYSGGQAYSLAAVYLKKSNNIYCAKGGTTVQGGNAFNFTAANCGGTLPDKNYIATSSLVQINGGNAGYVVNQPFQGATPGMWFYAYQGGTAYSLAAVYLHR